MEKKKLLKLRTLNATKEMMQKAAVDAGRGKNWEGKQKKYEYYMYLRCQILDGILKVAVFLTEEMKKGNNRAAYEIFINPQGEEFVSWDVKEQKWRESMLDNLVGSWEAHDCADEEAWINPEGLRSIRRELGSEKKAYRALVDWQRHVREEQVKKRRKKETDPWDKEMEKIPELPKDWEQWCMRTGIPEHYIFYEYSRKEATEGYCSYCGKWVPVQRPRHNKKVSCPRCRNTVTYKATGKISRLCTNEYLVQLIQKTIDGFCLREFYVKRNYGRTSYDKPELWARESTRILYENGEIKTFCYEMYKNVEMRWCKCAGYSNYYYGHVGKVYTHNLAQLAKTVLKKSALPIIAKQESRMDVRRWLHREQHNPALEMAVKAGCSRLAKELAEASYNVDLLNQEETELAKILKIDNSRLRRLREARGGLQMLLWLQREKKENTIFKDEMLEYFNKHNIGPKNLLVAPSQMTCIQIYHYLRRQQELCGDTPAQILQTWQDYLSMAKRARMQMDKEMIYKPKNLAQKHAELIGLFKKDGIKKEAKQWEKKFGKVNERCKELGKYEYADKKYMIVAPKNIEDIVREGTILNHCIHTSDIYFDRIQKRETYLLFLRKANAPDTPYYTLEVEPGGNIRQKRTVGDTQTKDFEDALNFLRKWQKELQKRLTKEDKELGKKSNEMRQQEYKKLYQEQKRVWRGALAGKLLAEVLENDFMGIEELEEEAV